MVSSKWKRLVLVLIVLLGILLGGMFMFSSYFAKKGFDLASDYLKNNYGLDVEVSSITGSFFGGFKLKGVYVTYKGKPILESKMLFIKPSWGDLIKKELKLKSINMVGAKIYYDHILEFVSAIPKDEDERGIKLPVKTFLLNDSFVIANFGKIYLKSFNLKADDEKFVVVFDASFKTLPVKGIVDFGIEENLLEVRSAILDIGSSGELFFNGKVLPVLNLSGKVNELAVKDLAVFWPNIKGSFGGVLSLKFELKGLPEDIKANGEILLQKATFWDMALGDIKGKWEYKDDVLEVRDIRTFGKRAFFDLKGDVVMKTSTLPPKAKYYVVIKHLDLRKFLSKSIDGIVNFIKIAGDMDFATKSGNFKVSGKDLSFYGQRVDSFGIDFTLRDNRLLNYSGTFVLNGEMLSIKGSGLLPKNIKGSLSGGRLILNKLLPQRVAKDLSLKAGLYADLNYYFTQEGGLSLKGKVFTKKASIFGGKISRFLVNFVLSGNKLNIQNAVCSLEGMSFNLNGSVDLKKDVTSSLLNLNGSVNVADLNKVKGFVLKLINKGINLPHLAGRCDVSFKVKGVVRRPDILFNASSLKLKVADKLLLKGITCDGKVLENKALDIGFNIKQVDYGSFVALVSDVSSKMSLSDKGINIVDLKARSFGGKVILSGSIPSKNGIAVSVLNIDLSRVYDALPIKYDFGIYGRMNLKATIFGDFKNPYVNLSGDVDGLKIGEVEFKSAFFRGKGNLNSFIIDDILLTATKGSIKGKKIFSWDSSGLKVEFDLLGNNVDAGVVSAFVQSLKDKFKGSFDFNIVGSYSDGVIDTKGSLKSLLLSFYNAKIKSLKTHFVLKDNVLDVKPITFNAYDGNIDGDFSYNLKTSSWKAKFKGDSIKLNPFLKDVALKKGDITGIVRFDISLKGRQSAVSTVYGNGNVVATDGLLKNFTAIESVLKLFGLPGIRYKRASFVFDIGIDGINLIPGSRITAYADDPLYRYLSVNGKIGFDGKLNLSCAGNVNVSALNALLGALRGFILLGEGFKSPEEMLSNLLGNIFKELKKSDFKNIKFKIKGTYKKPKISDLQIDMNLLDGQNQKKKTSNQVGINISIPVGEGEGSADVKEQIKKQIIENIFKQVNP